MEPLCDNLARKIEVLPRYAPSSEAERSSQAWCSTSGWLVLLAFGMFSIISSQVHRLILLPDEFQMDGMFAVGHNVVDACVRQMNVSLNACVVQLAGSLCVCTVYLHANLTQLCMAPMGPAGYSALGLPGNLKLAFASFATGSDSRFWPRPCIANENQE